MTEEPARIVLELTGAEKIISEELIQELWSGFGKIFRICLEGYSKRSIIVKHIHLPAGDNHPRGWNTDISRERKLFSYRVETHWYNQWSRFCDDSCPVPLCLGMKNIGDETLLLLEDLKEAGYPYQKTSVNWNNIKAGLRWLAGFHGTFLNEKPEGLWNTGTYWHLETRPDELKVLRDRDLKKAAPLLDSKLNSARFQTFVHGDAKLANFCFSADGNQTAAVDFQYIGGGCGMKDVAYFVGSCLTEHECEDREKDILDYYFSVLRTVLKEKKKHIDPREVELEWRSLYYAAWTDFFRFLKGWNPGHWKLNSYSEKIARIEIDTLKESGGLL